MSRRFSKMSGVYFPKYDLEEYKLWLPPENPKLLEEFKKKLKTTAISQLFFQMYGCPADCEICQNTHSCAVCRTRYELTSTGSCSLNKGYSPDGFYFASARRSVFGESSTIFSGGGGLSNFMTGYPGFQKLIIDADFDKTFDDSAPASSFVCNLSFSLVPRVAVAQLR